MLYLAEPNWLGVTWDSFSELCALIRMD